MHHTCRFSVSVNAMRRIITVSRKSSGYIVQLSLGAIIVGFAKWGCHRLVIVVELSCT